MYVLLSCKDKKHFDVLLAFKFQKTVNNLYINYTHEKFNLTESILNL